ncbi:hypothetical protein HPP92_017954 [Vanilla planifolia]|uniref:Uncharacterized protein n=1 Tax=Vanilla planifolia TaxID=51239 RepID=A0A835QFR8_VANPL|nr:hypothetical protein HPP92_018527 [Vanilla planifolia]KAG0468626.1 hypothetical protein HPP92_017954 [Vanilla planifolia]
MQEIVNLETESKGSDKGLNSPKGSITLSALLNLELMWPREVEENDSSISCNAPSHVAPTSLSGINLDNFFSDQKNEISSSPLQASHVDTHDLNLSSLDLDTFF